jgi:DNA-binding Xre family transcriptional regulator
MGKCKNPEVYTVKLKVKEYLDTHQKSAYALWKASGLPRNTVYSLSQGKAMRLDLETLGKLLYGLEQLTGETVTPNDLLEVVRHA